MKLSFRPSLVASAAAIAVTAGLLTAAPAAADTVFPTYGSGVRVRADASTSSAVVATLGTAESIGVDCQKQGDTVTVDGHSSSWWAHVPSKGGYVTVSYVDVPEGKLPDIPECGGTTPPPTTGDVTYTDLTAMFPGKVGTQSIVQEGLSSLNAEMRRANITTPARKAAFLATLANESTFRYNADQGTGSTYTGRGYIQLTGSANYTSAGSYFGINLTGNPALAKSLQYSAPIARWYWTVARNINPLADALDMGRVDAAIGYATDPAEDVERCNDFKSALRYLSGSVPSGINCTRPSSASTRSTQGESAREFAPEMRRLLESVR